VIIGREYTDRELTEPEVRDLISEGFSDIELTAKRVLVIIPDSTRTAPIPLMFRLLQEVLGARTEALDFLVALGTHPSMDDEALSELVGAKVTHGRVGEFHVLNHRWDDPETFMVLGDIPAEEVERISDGRLSLDVPVRLNRLILDYDLLLVCGPVFPHEVVGFSGGNKYFFPGISGQEVIDVTHWLGALITSMAVIGVADTPVRRMIDRAATVIPTRKRCLAMVMEGDFLRGITIGGMKEAWRAAAELSAKLNVKYVERRFRRILSVMPEMYDDIWTGAKGMYKLETVVADGGEVIVYAPHIDEISYTHGEILDEIGYHVRDYFVKQWECFKDYPWSVLAHSTHLRGLGTYKDGVEEPRIRVTLATGIPRERCEHVNLGFRDADKIDPEEWRGREDEGILLVPHAGEMLFRLAET
jgi:nickel-dependent lactate racemase